MQDNCHKRQLQNLLQSNSLSATILSPTRVALTIRDGQPVTTSTLIDNIFINTLNEYHSGVLEVSISDHFPVFTILSEHKMPVSDDDLTIKYRIINDHTLSKFKYALENNPEIKDIYEINSGLISFSKFFNIFIKLYDKYFPIKIQKLTRKGIHNPWVNLTLISRMKIRDNLSKLAKRNIIDRKIYTNFRNLLTTQIRNAKAEYYTKKFSEDEGNIKNTQRTINNVIKPNNKLKDHINKKNSNTLVSSGDVPNKLIDYFTGIA